MIFAFLILNVIILCIWYNYVTQCNIAFNLSNKDIMHNILKNFVAMPTQYVLDKPINELPINFRFPIVLKPSNSAQGKNIYTNIMNNDDLFKKTSLLLSSNKKIVMENQIMNMRECRVLINKKLKHISIIEKKYISVIGDGIHTIEQLVKKKNKIKTDKRYNIVIDENIINKKSIPPKNKKIIINYKRNAHMGADGIYIDISTVHPDNIILFNNILKYVNEKVIGIDVLFCDLSKSHKESPIKIIEANDCPGFDKKRLLNTEFKYARHILYKWMIIINAAAIMFYKNYSA